MSVTGLASWVDGPTKSAIVEYVDRVVAEVEPESRIAVFDNDGTLWCEKPMYIQLDFLIRRFAEQANS
ncbi:MAG: haloacid dehalogenase-like hydrolase, partial [Mycobacterium sp.]|nr:haloacid dehalogenase-like hydrolase [Mycobacterium sp.]